MDIFLEGFFQKALIGGVLIGFVAPLIGIFLVLRRLSMIGDTLAHVTVAGVAFGLLMGFAPVAVGLVFAVTASIVIEHLRKAYKTYAELSIAIMMSGGIALATLLFTLGKGFNINVMSYLFGSVYTLTGSDLFVILGVVFVVAGAVILHFKELFLLFFDEDAANVAGLPVRWFNIGITVLAALVISSAIKIVGALLVSALMTIPVACSLVVAKSFRHAVMLAVLFGEVAVILGLSVAGIWDLAPGATIVFVLLCLLSLLLFMRRGFKI